MNIVLIGYRGSGKSTVGRRLTGRLGWSFVDTDHLIQERSGMTIREIFADLAEEGFRQIESQLVLEVSRRDRQVISTGGGVVLRPENVATLKRTGRLIYLAAPAEVLWRRILADTQRQATRLRVDPHHSLQQVRQALLVRDPIYRRVADGMINTAHRSIDSIVERIIAHAGSRSHADA